MSLLAPPFFVVSDSLIKDSVRRKMIEKIQKPN